jgi:predicted transcriptional regulator of viral defense system
MGVLAHPSRGLYELADVEVGLDHSLAEIARRVPRGVVCLISALQFHGITLQIPSNVWVAIDTRASIIPPPGSYGLASARSRAASRLTLSFP